MKDRNERPYLKAVGECVLMIVFNYCTKSRMIEVSVNKNFLQVREYLLTYILWQRHRQFLFMKRFSNWCNMALKCYPLKTLSAITKSSYMHNRLRHSKLRLRSQGGARSIFVNPRHGRFCSLMVVLRRKKNGRRKRPLKLSDKDCPPISKRCGCANQVETAGS
jgi:hypothetical protein